jgi:alpha-amylase
LYGYGTQHNYWDEVDCIGWTRIGREGCDEKEGCAVLLSSAKQVKRKRMFVGKEKSGVVYMDVVGGGEISEVEIGDDGYGIFEVKARHAGVWIKKEEAERFV